MKKNSFILKALLAGCFCFFTVFVSNAQTEVRFGVKAGFNASNISGTKDLMKGLNEITGGLNAAVSKYIPRFHGGVISQISFSRHFFLQPELLYSLQGYREEYVIDMGTYFPSGDQDYDFHYFQLPIYAGYKINTSQYISILFGVGPYFAYAFSGNDNTFGDDGILRRFDFGLTAMEGIQYKKLQFTVGYDLGLTDMVDINGWKTAKDLYGLSSICNRNFKVSVAYFF
ncbi:hypothetical protein EZS27_000455 [termite gut metagenome]|uniref:Outer membrane protein beta-barrel domain-containing protein n=1 Tax=termite gut metagenome TaxID=433724 RepID=A0A5J4T3K5_9ZZZZ